MKKLIPIFCILITLAFCKKKNGINEDGKNESSQYPPHCFNKIKDQDETAVDCGGQCESCVVGTPVAPACTTTANTFTINNVNYTAGMGTKDTGAYYNVNGVYGNSQNYRLTLKSAPDQTKVYNIDGSIPDQATEAAMQFQYNLTTVYLTSGKVYFKNNGGSYTAVICNGSGVLSNISIPVKANFTFQ
jgi:hypothetical protein